MGVWHIAWTLPQVIATPFAGLLLDNFQVIGKGHGLPTLVPFEGGGVTSGKHLRGETGAHRRRNVGIPPPREIAFSTDLPVE